MATAQQTAREKTGLSEPKLTTERRSVKVAQKQFTQERRSQGPGALTTCQTAGSKKHHANTSNEQQLLKPSMNVIRGKVQYNHPLQDSQKEHMQNVDSHAPNQGVKTALTDTVNVIDGMLKPRVTAR